jgi:hypothetical protein
VRNGSCSRREVRPPPAADTTGVAGYQHSTAPDLVNEVLALLDDGDYAQVDRMLSALISWAPDEAELSALRHAYHQLHGLLTDAGPGCAGSAPLAAVRSALRTTTTTDDKDVAELVVGRAGTYQLAPHAVVWLDVDQFDRHRTDAVAAARRTDRSGVLAHAEAAAALYRGPLFEDADDEDWHLDERAALQARYCDVLQTLAERHLERGAPATAEAVARELVTLDPCREPGHRLLMLVHLADGDAATAARQYLRCVEILRDELGSTPSRGRPPSDS